MTPEIYFLRYARPCADFMVQKKEITENDLKRIDDMLYERTAPDRNFIEKIFYKAIKPLKKMSKNYWNNEVIKKYFCEVHNSLIDNSCEGFEHLKGFQKKLCKVNKALITKVDDSYYEASINNENVRILKGWVDNAKIGDTLIVHYLLAVEKK